MRRILSSRSGFRVCLFLIFLVLWGSKSFAQDAAQYGTPFAGVPDPRDVNIYQVAIGEYSSSRNFAGVTAGLDNIKALGTNVIYLMPIYPVGSSGSPYSITDFGGINSAFGSLSDLRALVDGAHSRGMAVILDWVGYESAIDHPWASSHPEYYAKDASGNLIHPFPDCTVLNTANSTVANIMIQYMRNWIFTANIDGFRCDYADYPASSYWKTVITNLRGITSHKLLFLAEGSNNTAGAHYSEGFDFIFGENYYWNFTKKVYNNGESATNIDGITTGEYAGASATNFVARYLSNHDEYGTDGSPFTWLTGGKAAVMSTFVIATYMRGVPFIYNGIEVGNTSTLVYPWNSGTINWTQDLTVLSEMKKIMAFRVSSDAIRRGTPTTYTTTNVVAFTKTSASQTAFVAVNVRNSSQTFTLPAGIANTTMYDAFTGTSTALGTSITLSPYQYLAYVNSVVNGVAVTGVSMSPTTATVSTGSTTQLTASITPSNASNKNVTWTSSNTAIATVSASGLVTGVAAGTATITVKTTDGAKTATCAVTVQAAPKFTVYFYPPSTWGTGIKIYWWSALPSGTLADGTWPGVSMTLASGWYSYTFNNVSSTNLIFNDGTNQTANLSRTKDGWYKDGVWYDTNPGTNVAVTGVSLSPTSASLSVAGTQQLTASITPSNATNKNVSWTSSNTAVATVSSTGLVTAIAAGTAVITVSTADQAKTATCAITVTSSAITYYQIVNRWQTTTYLRDNGNGQVTYGTSPSSTDYAYQWQKIDMGSGYFQLKNRSTGNFMHIENLNGSVQCGAIQSSWYSAQWSLPSTGDGWNDIQNRYQTADWVHIENLYGYAQYAGPQTGWYSAEWQFVNGTTKSAQLTSTIEKKDQSIVIPNPVSEGVIRVLASNPESIERISIWDINGRLLYQTTDKLSEYRINASAFAKGVYLVKIEMKESSQTKRLVIE